MQIVIEISEYDYDFACKWPDALIGVYAHAIKNGTPLPKGHGRLVDGDALWNRMSCYSDDYGAGFEYANDDENPIIHRDSAMEVIENAPTIIEADKESEDK